MKRKFAEGFVKILLLEAVFLICIFVFFTVLRFVNIDLFTEVCKLYNEYFMSDVSLSLVIGE